MTIGNLKNYSTSQKGGAVVIGVTALYFMFVVWVLPALSDDLWYSSCIGEYLSGHSSSPDWGKWWGSICAHFTMDNVRLSNLLYHLLIFLPHVISAVILSLGFPLLLILMTRLAGCPRPTFCSA